MSEENKVTTNEDTENESTKVKEKSTIKKASSPKSVASDKPKQLTLTQNKKVATQLNKMEEYELESVEALIKFYPEFSYDRIQDLIKELANSLDYIQKNEIEINENLYIDYVFFLTIKHFTHLKKSLASEFDKQIIQMNELVATGVFKEIIESVFQPKEIKKVLDSLGDIVGNTVFLERIEQQAKNKLAQLELQNKDMLNVFSNEALAGKLN